MGVHHIMVVFPTFGKGTGLVTFNIKDLQGLLLRRFD